MKGIITLFCVCLLAACATRPQQNSGTMIYRVNSYKAPCTAGVMPTTCLLVKKGEAGDGNWQMFYSTIEGFDFQPGFLYKLEVEETRLPAAEVPADGSAVRYRLVRLLEKTPDPRTVLNDIWRLERIDGAELTFPADAPRPHLELKLSDQSVLGNDGCESFRGKLQGNGSDLSFIQLATPGAACSNHTQSRLFREALQAVRSFEYNNRVLLLFDASKKERLRFRKTD